MLEFLARNFTNVFVVTDLNRSDGVESIGMINFCESLVVDDVPCFLKAGQSLTYSINFTMPFVPAVNQGPSNITIKLFDENKEIFFGFIVPVNIERCVLCLVSYILRQIFF